MLPRLIVWKKSRDASGIGNCSVILGISRSNGVLLLSASIGGTLLYKSA